MNKKLTDLLHILIISLLIPSNLVMAAGYRKTSKSSYVAPKKPKSYMKKASLEGLGKPSKANRLPKTKVTNGHFKRTSKGYTRINPYARSK